MLVNASSKLLLACLLAEYQSSAEELVMARDAIRVGCRVGAGISRGREETQLL
jgi:hypothetical protein